MSEANIETRDVIDVICRCATPRSKIVVPIGPPGARAEAEVVCNGPILTAWERIRQERVVATAPHTLHMSEPARG